MKTKAVLFVVLLAAAAASSVWAADSSAADSPHPGGYVYSDGMSVTYHGMADQQYVTIEYDQKPQTQYVSVTVLSGDDPAVYQWLPGDKMINLRVGILDEGEHLFFVTGYEGQKIGECTLNVIQCYQVKFSPGTGSGDMMPSEVSVGGLFLIPECTYEAPSGGSFVYWSDGKTSYKPGDSINVSSDLTLEAVWESGSQGGGSDLPIYIITVVVILAVIGVAVFLGRRKS